MTKTTPNHVAQCRCGAVEIGGWGDPLVVAACYCDDCQAASERLAASANGAPAARADGGTEFMVFRRDRIACMRDAENLQPMRLTAASKTRRMIADCCATPMYVSFDDKRPWVSALRAGFGAGAPPVEMRICTRFRRPETSLRTACPSTPAIRPR
jgi:hypothetical protein